jgi:eukaryotic-like serine/threonine-protein kinase
VQTFRREPRREEWEAELRILDDGEVIRDTYEVERMLGRGAFAEVYRVRDLMLHRRLAMKVFKSPVTSLSDLEKLLEEGRILAALEHPNIVRLFEAGLIDRSTLRFGYFTMECVAGGSLATYWRSYGSRLMPVDEAVNVIRQTCRGLDVAHRKTPPIVHRDVKPENILIGYDGDGLRVRVSDFGLARAVDPLTLLATARGTLGFKPPEALDDQDSTQSDIWAIGTTLYLLLSDQLPYPLLDERDATDARRFLRPLRPPSVYNIAVDPALDTIVYRCLAADPGDRYANAADLLLDLGRWQPSAGLPQFEPGVSRSDIGGLSLKDSGRRQKSPAATQQETPQAIVRQALTLAKKSGQLDSAADLLEQAINRDPDLRARHAEQLRLWRRGIVM